MESEVWRALEEKHSWGEYKKEPAVTTNYDRIMNIVSEKSKELSALDAERIHIEEEFGEEYTFSIQEKIRKLKYSISHANREAEQIRIFDQFFKDLIDELNLGFFANGKEDVVKGISLLNSPLTSVFAFPYSTRERTEINCCFGTSPYLAIKCNCYLYNEELRFEMEFAYFFPTKGEELILYYTNIHGGKIECKKSSPDRRNDSYTEFDLAHFHYYRDKLDNAVEKFIRDNKLDKNCI